MSKKLTLKDKIREGFMCASKMRHYALRLEQDAKDFGWSEARTMAKEMADEALEYMNKLR